MPQEQWDRKYNQGVGTPAFRKSWRFGRSDSELSLSDLIFYALDPLCFLKVRSCDGVLSQPPEITKQETPPGWEETQRLGSQTPVCHTDMQPILTSLREEGKQPFWLSWALLMKASLRMDAAHSSSPWTARFSIPARAGSSHPPVQPEQPFPQLSTLAVSLFMQYFLQGRQKLLTVVLPFGILFSFGQVK